MITLRIEFGKLKITFTGAGFQEDLKIVKDLDNRMYDPDGKFWTATITEKNREKIMENKAHYLNPGIISKYLDGVPDEVLLTEKQEKDLEHFINVKLPFLWKFQVKDVVKYCAADNIGNFNEMGLGKTIETGAYIYLARNHKKELEKDFPVKMYGDKILIVAPNSLKYQWQRELKKHFGLHSIVIDGTPEKRKTQWSALSSIEGKFIIITNYENLSRSQDIRTFRINKVYFDLLICDEISRCKNFSTGVFKSIAKMHAKKVVGLTGTPVENHLKDVYTIMKLIEPDLFPQWVPFKAKYFRTGYFGELKNRQGSSQAIARELGRFNGFIRWKRESVLEDLPELLLNVYNIDFTPKERKEYKKIEDGIRTIRNKEGKQIDMKFMIAKMTALRRVCSDPAIYLKMEKDSAKKREFMKVVQDNINGRKILIFSQFKDVIYNYAKSLKEKGIKSMIITGDIGIKTREIIIDKFEKHKEVNILMCTDALAYGANLQFCSTLINIDMPWNPAVLKQRIGRIHRIGQQADSISVISFLINKTIESTVYKKILAKNKIFDIVITDNEQEAEVAMLAEYLVSE